MHILNHHIFIKTLIFTYLETHIFMVEQIRALTALIFVGKCCAGLYFLILHVYLFIFIYFWPLKCLLVVENKNKDE